MKCKQLKENAWIKARIPLFILDVILIAIGLLLMAIDVSKCTNLLYNPFILALLAGVIILHVYPVGLNGLIAKYCNQNVADRVAPTGEDIDKIKAGIKEASVSKGKDKKEVRTFIKKEITTDIQSLVNDFNEKKYKKIVLRAKHRINNGGDVRYNILLELAYSGLDVSEYDMDDRIANLTSIIKRDIPINLKISFIISYIGCNLFSGSYTLVEHATYRAINLIKKAEQDPKYLAILYKMQMDNFVMQNKISEAISSGNKALEYADDKDSCRIYFSLAQIYFYFLDDSRASLKNALSAWNQIYKDAPFTKELVQLCYVNLFFDDKIEAACDFLLNFTQNEKDDSYKDNLSYLLYKKGDIKSALNNATYCINQNKKESVASLNTLAQIAKDEGKYKEAVNYFSEAIPGLEPNNQVKLMKVFWLEALYNRAVCYIKLGNFENAKSDMDIVLRENYDGIDADILREYHDLNPEHVVENTKA